MMQTEAAEIVKAIPLPAILIRRDERIAAANAPAETLLGQGIEGRHFITALRQPALLDAIEACLREGSATQASFLTQEGHQDMTYRVTARAVITNNGPTALVCFEDVTPMEQAGQMRRDFVANVSHELKTPLTALMGFIETLRGPAREDPVAQERFLGIMASEASRMNRLIGDLLSLSRVEAEERMKPTDRINLSGLVRSTLHGLTPLAEDAGVRVNTDLPDHVTIPGDEDQLQQVLANLIENAIKYTGRGACVSVSLGAVGYEPRLRRNGVRLIVRDDGPGIDPVHLPRLTERFYRVDNHRSREMGGTGLGLAIVKHIVNRHRGRMRIDSELGQGTEFTVILPSD